MNKVNTFSEEAKNAKMSMRKTFKSRINQNLFKVLKVYSKTLPILKKERERKEGRKEEIYLTKKCFAGDFHQTFKEQKIHFKNCFR